ncbi:transcriptional regulator with XRE-family HTH domain [Natranaerovirga pectinivora]|uniref:Transcriptional regulator with XRE-family HTH domain n=1 Tax=Natranaerovirga pectinivora TaxID=682400 RepID=A0A4V2V0N5_9FIRM|nr:helix-turn-helix transcriptional regulator [Natranaerovirga pectinivora]TCT17039.1 transcriptional regulator with XRE-family HTH domain [Natranaerovirga pectinivora]
MKMRSIGSFIASLRKANGMTQQEVADRLLVSNKTVSKWERNESYPDITLIPVIAEMFDVTSDEIINGGRISKDNLNTANKNSKTEKQTKRLFDTTRTKFKNMSAIALALVLLGLISLFTIAYSTHRPIIGFGVFLVFALSSVILQVIHINLSHLTLNNNDLLQEFNEELPVLRKQLNTYSFYVFFGNIVAVIFALPFIIVRDAYNLNSVISMNSYFLLVPFLLLISFFIWCGLLSIFQHKIVKNKLENQCLSVYNKIKSINTL